ncbi:MAG: anhydro-N-acetylmuramic acid kinase [Dongiaceae bacterium]
MADTSNKPRWALGMMSGTSCDGIDAALVETDGETEIIIGAALAEPYGPEFRARLMSVMGLKGPVAEVEKELTERHAAVAKRLLSDNGLEPKDVALIGFHGQTLLHQPDLGRTKQIGDGALLAKLTGIDVVNDFRSNDMAHGGQGAPFVPLFHAALAASMKRPVAVLNIGGVANVTWVGEGAVKGTAGAAGNAPVLAFDTGPGNALMDDWALKHTGQAVDKDGALAAKGKVDDAALAKLMSHPYFARKAPKSLDRNDFDASPVASLSPEDGAATLAAFTVASIVKAAELFPAPARRWIVAGGGRRNPVVMAGLAGKLGVPVAPAERAGWNGDMLEAQAFGYLAVRSVRGLPLSVPGTTGVKEPVTGGKLHKK